MYLQYMFRTKTKRIKPNVEVFQLKFISFASVNITVSSYENTPMQHTAIFHGCKNDHFQLNFFTIFIFLLKT